MLMMTIQVICVSVCAFLFIIIDLRLKIRAAAFKLHPDVC